MIKKFKDYEQTKSYGGFDRLPKGGYVLVIKGAEVLSNRIGEYIKIAADIYEGEFIQFFTREYKNQQTEDKKWHCNYLLNIPKDDGSEQDGWTKRKFKTFTEALEESNEGYHFDWDEQKFKGKLIGGLFNEREYEGRDGAVRKATNWANVCTVDKIREGSYTLPDDKLLKGSANPAPASVAFMDIPDGIDDELPFH